MDRRPPRPTGDAHSQSLLRRLCRGRGGGELRAGLSAGNRGYQLSSRSRRALRRAARAHRCFLHRLAGHRQFLARFLELRNVSAPQVPMPAQRVAIAAYGDEAHVEENRRLYAQKFDLADQIIGDRYGYRRPAGGFFLWLDVSAQGGDEAVALRLWREAGLRVVPGRYLARDQADGSNPGLGYIRAAMVQDQDTTAQTLHRLVAVLG